MVGCLNARFDDLSDDRQSDYVSKRSVWAAHKRRVASLPPLQTELHRSNV